MKRTLLTLSLVLVSLFASAQDSVEVYRFTYEFRDSNVIAKRNYPDRMHLDVQQNGASEFYSKYGQELAESEASAVGMTQEELMVHLRKMQAARNGANYRILKNFPERGKMTVTDRTALSDVYYTEETPQPVWTLCDGEKELCGYPCKRAEADFLGRHWTAWFAEDLPLNNGPWKLGGLPGLILEAYDADNFFHFTCIGIEIVNVLPTKSLDKKFVKCSRKDVNRMEREFNNDREGFMNRLMESRGGSDAFVKVLKDKNGKDIKSLPNEERIYIEKIEGDKR